mmetsp:Transcript_39280/g.121427  ORF Transcript_39280/g.121427 Transcript_39280/m.121427 type:complete len:258 (-) Transcript_39280:121-894(-)|eukprot:CAMPEP_0174851184 /NCGR_PEP_ID=MMETSP1114-20130205/22148_1 /TAXON_ID=312471 /ORGANISM="Neobodo designis, Strain CCAP 1951/1" /LENGTH=257 /DNA_ID=CAMNT_0016085701 /DNA_START=180 /DNA_END=953 /DNA_ORIENTATION=-
MSAKSFIDGGRAAGNFRNMELEEKGQQKPRGGAAEPAPAGNFAGHAGDGGMSRFDRLVSNREFEDEDDGAHDAGAAACPYGDMGRGSGGSGGGGITTGFVNNNDGGIECDGDESEDDEEEVEIMAPEEAVQVRLSGYLKKFAVGRSGFFKNWKRRFFVCDGGVLQYFESETSKQPLSTIDLANGQGLRLVTRPTKRTHPEVLDPSLDLVLVFAEPGSSEERKLLLRADDPDDHTQWAVVMGAFTPLVDHPMDFPVPV